MEQFNLGRPNVEHNIISSFSAGQEDFIIEQEEKLQKIDSEIAEIETSLSLNDKNQTGLSRIFLKLGIGMVGIRDRLNSLYKNRHSLENQILKFKNLKSTEETLH